MENSSGRRGWMGSRGRDKKAYIAALWQAKIYPPQQAAAAADRGLRPPQSMRQCSNSKSK